MSIREIAREAGTSISTVSRVLNDPGYKCRSEELRDRIREVAMEHNYTPNPAARFLKSKTPEKLFYINVLMARTDKTQTDPFFSELLRVIETQIRKNTCILYVPAGSVDAYKAKPGWNEFKNILAIGTTAINGVVISDDGKPFDIYNMQGRKVKDNVTSFDGLPSGIYIVNGKKVMVK